LTPAAKKTVSRRRVLSDAINLAKHAAALEYRLHQVSQAARSPIRPWWNPWRHYRRQMAIILALTDQWRKKPELDPGVSPQP
jgi:hypothetical protein